MKRLNLRSVLTNRLKHDTIVDVFDLIEAQRELGLRICSLLEDDIHAQWWSSRFTWSLTPVYVQIEALKLKGLL